MGKKEQVGSSTTWKQRLGLTRDEVQHEFKGHQDDLIILFMGPTGVGKSTFVKEYTGKKEVLVGHQLQSCTRDVAWYEATMPADIGMQGRLILVDTPGFDDTFSDDSEILRRVSAWLARSYNCAVPIAGIVYMNDITQKRMFGSTRMNLNMFTKLCGPDSYSRVVLATSQWDNLPSGSNVGESRQEELKKSFWADVVEGGARVMPIRNKPEDQRAIIRYLLRNHDKQQEIEQEFLQIQKEIVDLEKTIPSTKAGRELKYTLEELLKLQKASMGNKLDEQGRQDLAHKQQLLKEQIKTLKLSFGERFKKFFGLG